MWGTIIDVVVIAIIVISAIVGIVKGLIDSILSLFGTAIAVFGGAFLAKYVSPYVNKIFDLENFLTGKLNAANEGTVNIFGASLENSEVAKFCVWIISVIAIFLVIKLVLFILTRVFESITKNSPTVSGINRVLGMLFGTVKGGVIVVACLAICSLLSGIPGIGTTVTDKIGETKITKWANKYVDEFVEDNLTAEKIQDIVDRIMSESEDPDDGDNNEDSGSEGSGSENGGSEGAGNGGTENGGSEGSGENA